ncbi:hypothetical protein, partial [Mesorhizobium sp. M1273]|uniref:hypothetical protein n=1 Tax=Mesorhizobium sp. M1273 TaxID=2957075 RepID=UPI003338A3F3
MLAREGWSRGSALYVDVSQLRAKRPMDQKLRGNLPHQTLSGKRMSALPISLRGAKLDRAHSVFIACFRKSSREGNGSSSSVFDLEELKLLGLDPTGNRL